MNEISKLPQRIKELRTREKLTQGEFAKKIGLTPATVSAYENEEHTKTPSLKVLINIANTFNVSLDWLCGIGAGPSKRLNTYKDAIETIISLGDNFKLNIYCEIKELPPDFDDYLLHESNFQIEDYTIFEFFDGWKKIYDLYKEGTIDYSLYYLWVERELKKSKYSNPIFSTEGNSQFPKSLSFADLDDDDEVPF